MTNSSLDVHDLVQLIALNLSSTFDTKHSNQLRVTTQLNKNNYSTKLE